MHTERFVSVHLDLKVSIHKQLNVDLSVCKGMERNNTFYTSSNLKTHLLISAHICKCQVMNFQH